MGIGVPAGRGRLRKTLSQKLAEPGVESWCWPAALHDNIPLVQGQQMAVAAVGSCASDLLTPPVPGGLQFEKVVVVVKEQPTRPFDLACRLKAANKLHQLVNYTMAQPGYFDIGVL